MPCGTGLSETLYIYALKQIKLVKTNTLVANLQIQKSIVIKHVGEDEVKVWLKL